MFLVPGSAWLRHFLTSIYPIIHLPVPRSRHLPDVAVMPAGNPHRNAVNKGIRIMKQQFQLRRHPRFPLNERNSLHPTAEVRTR
ncbi:MAG: hypothetical protein AAF989_01840, partial [Planctomycetota bacterium]